MAAVGQLMAELYLDTAPLKLSGYLKAEQRLPTENETNSRLRRQYRLKMAKGCLGLATE